MRKTLMIGAVLLLSSTALGATLAAGRHVLRDHGGSRAEDNASQDRRTLASEHADRRHEGKQHRRYADNDDDEDEDDDGGSSRAGRPVTPAPDAPVPDSGLFNGKARPKADVQ
jgi:hypothetical protein